MFIFPKPYDSLIFSEIKVRLFHRPGAAMQNFDDLDIEGRTPSHLSETGKEKVKHIKNCV